MKIGVIFPGQGTQHIGMGRSWYDAEREVQQHFEDASACVGINIAKLCFGSHTDELTKTVHAQLSIFVVSSALYHMFRKYTGVEPVMVAGHSSGEYAALSAAHGFSYTDALYMLKRRAQLMEQATRTHSGIMLAVLGLSPREVGALCAAFDKPGSYKRVAQVAAYNGPEQTVISCSPMLSKGIIDAVMRAGGRALKLPVSGGFHSRLMNSAQEQLVAVFHKITFKNTQIPVISNISAQPFSAAQEIIDELSHQLCAPVRWWDSMRHFASCSAIVQVGPGTTFANLLRRHWPEKRVFSFNDYHDAALMVRSLHALKAREEVMSD